MTNQRATVPTFVPKNLIGWWGGPDERVRCIKDKKVVLTQEKAERVALRSGMSAYIGKSCGYWHVGHNSD